MTPKEKAEELVNKYLNVEIHFYDADTVGTYIDIMRTSEAKQCAFIAIDEIILCLTKTSVYNGFMEDTLYWKQVKNEIELL